MPDIPEDDQRPVVDMLGDDSLDDADLPNFASRSGLIVRLVAEPASVAIASLVLGTASLIILQAASEIGEVYLVSSRHGSVLGEFRVACGVRLGIAVIAGCLALIAAFRQVADPLTTYLNSEAEGTPGELERIAGGSLEQVPVWTRVLIGAALLVAVLAVAINASAFIDAMVSTTPSGSNFG